MLYFVKILLIWLLCLLSVLLHESGHALGYRVSGGGAEWKIAAGSGPAIIRTRKIIFCPIPAGGYFISEEEPETKKGKLLMLTGGPVVSLLQAVLFGILCFCITRFIQQVSIYEILFPVSSFLLYFNFFQFLFTAIPIRYRVVCRGQESDGLQILHLLKQKACENTKSGETEP